MRYLRYAVKTELSDKTGFIINLTVSVLVIYFILQYFGAYKATAKNMFEGSTDLVVSVSVNEKLPEESYLRLKRLKGYLNAALFCGEIRNSSERSVLLWGRLENIPEKLMPIGKPIEDNTDTDAVYIPNDYAEEIHKGIGDAIFLVRNKENGVILLFDEASGDVNDIKTDIFDVIPLTVAGTFINGTNAFYFPLNTALENFSVNSADIAFDRSALTENDYNSVIREIMEIFGNADDSHSDFDKVYAVKLMQRRIESMFYFLLGMLCIVFLYSFVLSRRIRRFSVCRLCGASKKAVGSIIVLGSLIIYLISFGLALLLGILLNYKVFIPSFGYNSFDLSECGTLFLMTLAIYAVVVTVYISKFVKNSAVGIYRRSE